MVGRKQRLSVACAGRTLEEGVEWGVPGAPPVLTGRACVSIVTRTYCERPTALDP